MTADIKNVYLAGPMRNKPNFNFPQFHAVTAILRQSGYHVFSPAEHDEQTYGAHISVNPTGDELAAEEQGFNLRDALGADTAWISKHADAVFMLDGWENSAGACAEVALAKALGLPTMMWFEAGPCTTDDEAADMDFDNDSIDWKTIAGRIATRQFEGVATNGQEVRSVSSSGGEKGVKVHRFDLIPVGPLTQLAEHFGRGAQKYAERNYERGYEWSKSYAALQRHANAWWNGEEIDPETGSNHMTAVAWHAFALLLFSDIHRSFDDRPDHGQRDSAMLIEQT